MFDEVKLFLRVEKDFTEEDILIQGFIDEAKEYCRNAIGYLPSEDNPVFRKFVKLYVANSYDNRELATNGYEKANYNLLPLIMQLKYCYEGE